MSSFHLQFAGYRANTSCIETFSPALLKQQSRRLRKKSGSDRYIAPQELKSDAAFTLTQTFTRPITMLLFEPIVLFTGIFISLAWSMVFFYFQAYPIIFKRTFFKELFDSEEILNVCRDISL